MYTDKFTTAQALLMREELAGIELAIEGAIDLMVHHWPKISQIKTNAKEVTISLGIKLTPSGKQTKIQHRISYSETYKDSREDITEDPDQTQLFNDQPVEQPERAILHIKNGSMLAVPVNEIIAEKRGRGRPRKNNPALPVAPASEPEMIKAEIVPMAAADAVYTEPTIVTETNTTQETVCQA